jgi:two-component system, cell cycle response regulator
VELLIAHANAAARLTLAGIAEQIEDALDVVECETGAEALERLLADDAPALALIHWDLPGVDGLELCRLACQYHEGSPPYIILLAGAAHDIAAGLDAGAADCVHTPAPGRELRARIEVGRRLAVQLARRSQHARRDTCLVAECTPFDDADEPAPDGGFELQSVLVAE